MASFVAVLVEDDPQQVPESIALLESAGFEAAHFYDSSSALTGMDNLGGEFDLIVLDRRLPVAFGDDPSDGVGDMLLNTLASRYPDVPVVVFTGFSDYEHLQQTTQNRGAITLRGGLTSVDPVTTFKKGQAPEALICMKRLKEILVGIEDVELLGDAALDPHSRRLLKRVGYEFSGVSVAVQPLEDGASSARVWRCVISSSESEIAHVIVKRVKRRAAGYGFQTLLPARLAAATLHVVGGLALGEYAVVIQAADLTCQSLASLMEQGSVTASAAISQVIQALDEMPAGVIAHRPLIEMVEPFASWAEIEVVAAKFEIPLPSPTTQVTTRIAHQHGDLHPGNILVLDEAPILIDFDSQIETSRLVDPVALLLGGAFHKTSPLRTWDWPKAETFSTLTPSDWIKSCEHPEVLEACAEWFAARAEGPREMPAILFGFSLRQLTFPDVRKDDRLRNAAVSLAKAASSALTSS